MKPETANKIAFLEELRALFIKYDAVVDAAYGYYGECSVSLYVGADEIDEVCSGDLRRIEPEDLHLAIEKLKKYDP